MRIVLAGLNVVEGGGLGKTIKGAAPDTQERAEMTRFDLIKRWAEKPLPYPADV